MLIVVILSIYGVVLIVVNFLKMSNPASNIKQPTDNSSVPTDSSSPSAEKSARILESSNFDSFKDVRTGVVQVFAFKNRPDGI